MLRYILAIIISIHGLIHLMCFAKAFGYGNITQLTRDISKPLGLAWLGVAILFLVAIILLLIGKEVWVWLVLIAAIASQVLILTAWSDAKFGTVANIIAIAWAVTSWGAVQFESQFRKDTTANLVRTQTTQAELLTEKDIQHLPSPVQKYLQYTSAVGKPKVINAKIVFEGEMRDRGKDWFAFRSVQYNFFDQPTRLFFMKAQLFGVTVPGYHRYQSASASMDIRLFGLIPVVQVKGPEMTKVETVTVFNDMCILAPRH